MNIHDKRRSHRAPGPRSARRAAWIDGGLTLALGVLLGVLAAHSEGEARALSCVQSQVEVWELERVEVQALAGGGDPNVERYLWNRTFEISARQEPLSAQTNIFDRCDTLDGMEAAP